MNVLGGKLTGALGVCLSPQRDVRMCPSSAAVNSLLVVRPEIHWGKYDTGVEGRVSTMIVSTPAVAAGVCLAAQGRPVAGKKATSLRPCQRVSRRERCCRGRRRRGRRGGCRRGVCRRACLSLRSKSSRKKFSQSRTWTSRMMLPRMASTRNLSSRKLSTLCHGLAIKVFKCIKFQVERAVEEGR